MDFYLQLTVYYVADDAKHSELQKMSKCKKTKGVLVKDKTAKAHIDTSLAHSLM